MQLADDGHDVREIRGGEHGLAAESVYQVRAKVGCDRGVGEFSEIHISPAGWDEMVDECARQISLRVVVIQVTDYILNA